MGFGLLFFGFTLVLCMMAYSILPSFIGYFVCMYACLKLSEYEDAFKRSAKIFAGAAVFFMMQSFLALAVRISGNTLLEDFAETVQPVSQAVFYIGQLGLLPALRNICRDTGRVKTASVCVRDMFVYVLMFGLYVASNILIARGWEYSRYCLLYATLSEFVVLALTMIKVFSCYMWICREGEEEEERAEAETKLNRRVTKAFDRQKKKEPEPEPEVPQWIKNKRKKKK